jgi:predicted AAA+ superfamily ATPase
MIVRTAEKTLFSLAAGYPVLAVTGPRQSGKTTLVRAAFPEHAYASLENPAQREFAETDPAAFLRQFAGGAILDEAQRCPRLFEWLQGIVDESRQPGRFVLTGSQQFGLLSGITQSLAGRVALVTLLPFSRQELRTAGIPCRSVEEAVFQGGYPPIYDRDLDPATWFANYVQTYLERDVRQLVNVRNLTQFQRFLRLCAGRSGQLLNLSALGDEAGVSHNTAREWISVLEASFVIHRLPPQHRNFNKRLVKTPKLYFLDSGLAAWLIGIESAAQLATHPLRGALFETWVVAEFLKRRFHAGKPSNLSFWRDRSGHEIDLLAETVDGIQPIEIKATATPASDAFAGLRLWASIAQTAATRPALIYGGDKTEHRSDVDVVSWRDV